MGGCAPPAVPQPRGGGQHRGPGHHRADGGLRAAAVALCLRRHRLQCRVLRAGLVAGVDRDVPCRRRALVRHRFGRPRPVRARALRRARLAGGGAGGDLGQPSDRRALWRDGRLHRRAHRRIDDALRRRALFAALHLLRHHPDGGLQPQFLPAVRRHRRGGMADHGADRARPDAVHQAEGIHRGRARRRRRAPSASSAGTSSPTWWGR